jgi:hypothetical protein
MKLSWLLALTILVPQSLANDPVQILNQLNHASTAIRAQAALSYGDGCRHRKLRRAFRHESTAQRYFQKALHDPSPKVRKAAIHMALCFGPEKSLSDLGQTIADVNAETALAAMTQMAHFEHPLGVAPLADWMQNRLIDCQGTDERFRERCVFSAYALGQAAQHEPVGSSTKRTAVKALTPFLKAAHPKTREVSAVAMSFVGDIRDVPLISQLLFDELNGKYENTNSPEVLEHFKALITKLKLVAFK